MLKPAGLENAKDIYSADYLKDAERPAMEGRRRPSKEWRAFMDKYYPEGDKTSSFTAYGYAVAQTLDQVLKQSGDDLTRENVMKQAASMKDVPLDMTLPGITMTTSETDFYPLQSMQLEKFNGDRWELFGEVISGATN